MEMETRRHRAHTSTIRAHIHQIIHCIWWVRLATIVSYLNASLHLTIHNWKWRPHYGNTYVVDRLTSWNNVYIYIYIYVYMVAHRPSKNRIDDRTAACNHKYDNDCYYCIYVHISLSLSLYIYIYINMFRTHWLHPYSYIYIYT